MGLIKESKVGCVIRYEIEIETLKMLVAKDLEVSVDQVSVTDMTVTRGDDRFGGEWEEFTGILVTVSD